jgi:hypothetical protein
MKKTETARTVRKISLRRETVRSLRSSDLDQVAGGVWTEFTSCTPTMFNTCHVQTPGCPQ